MNIISEITKISALIPIILNTGFLLLIVKYKDILVKSDSLQLFFNYSEQNWNRVPVNQFLLTFYIIIGLNYILIIVSSSAKRLNRHLPSAIRSIIIVEVIIFVVFLIQVLSLNNWI